MNEFNEDILISLTKIGGRLGVSSFIEKVVSSPPWRNHHSYFHIIKNSLPCVSLHCRDQSRVVCVLFMFLHYPCTRGTGRIHKIQLPNDVFV